MFGLFGPEKVEFLDISDTTLTYRSKRKKNIPGTVAKINLQAYVGEGMQSLKMEVVIDSVRQLPDKSYLVVSQILAKPDEATQLTTILDSAPRPDIGKLARRSERIPIGIRVLSQQLPGFRAVTIDLSNHGAQLQTEELLEADSILDITFELELQDLPQITLRAVVIWAAAEEDRRKVYRGGVEFTEQHPQTQALFDKAYQQLLRMQSGSIMHRSMSADFTDQGPDKSRSL